MPILSVFLSFTRSKSERQRKRSHDINSEQWKIIQYFMGIPNFKTIRGNFWRVLMADEGSKWFIEDLCTYKIDLIMVFLCNWNAIFRFLWFICTWFMFFSNPKSFEVGVELIHIVLLFLNFRIVLNQLKHIREVYIVESLYNVILLYIFETEK